LPEDVVIVLGLFVLTLLKEDEGSVAFKTLSSHGLVLSGPIT
jgi:hypothetical protein